MGGVVGDAAPTPVKLRGVNMGYNFPNPQIAYFPMFVSYRKGNMTITEGVPSKVIPSKSLLRFICF